MAVTLWRILQQTHALWHRCVFLGCNGSLNFTDWLMQKHNSSVVEPGALGNYGQAASLQGRIRRRLSGLCMNVHPNPWRVCQVSEELGV